MGRFAVRVKMSAAEQKERLKNAIFLAVRGGASEAQLDQRFGHLPEAIVDQAIAELKAEGRIEDDR